MFERQNMLLRLSLWCFVFQIVVGKFNYKLFDEFGYTPLRMENGKMEDQLNNFTKIFFELLLPHNSSVFERNETNITITNSSYINWSVQRLPTLDVRNNLTVSHGVYIHKKNSSKFELNETNITITNSSYLNWSVQRLPTLDVRNNLTVVIFHGVLLHKNGSHLYKNVSHFHVINHNFTNLSTILAKNSSHLASVTSHTAPIIAGNKQLPAWDVRNNLTVLSHDVHLHRNNSQLNKNISNLHVVAHNLTNSSQFSTKRIYEQFTNVTSHTVPIIVGNKRTNRAEIYNVRITCVRQFCSSQTLSAADVIWISPFVKDTSEVKMIKYMGKTAVLMTTSTGAIVFAYPDKEVLFHRETKLNGSSSVHSAEVLPDGHVITVNAGTIKLPGSAVILNKNCPPDIDTCEVDFSMKLDKPHGVYYDKARNLLYITEYSKLSIFRYQLKRNKRPKLAFVTKIDIPLDYKPGEHDVEKYFHGGHDLYPIDGSNGKLFLSTGESVFQFDLNKQLIERYTFTTPMSNHVANSNISRNPAGVKVISKHAKSNFVFYHAAKFHRHVRYQYLANKLAWYNSETSCANGCNVEFGKNVVFYKARVFDIPQFYPPVEALPVELLLDAD